MNTDLLIPSSASLYILLQRTAYQSALLSRMLRLLPGPISLTFARIEAAARAKTIASRFRRGILRDYRSIATSLPPDAGAILDIGCGLAAIDILLSRHYSVPSPPELYLADFEEIASHIQYGYGPSHAKYNSIRVASQLLTLNGVPPQSLHFMSPQDIGRAHRRSRFHLVISTLAWGFHFPIETYAEAVFEAMAEEGKLILDIRIGTDGIEQLLRYFRLARVIEQTHVRKRVLVTK